jgi:uncharacterized RDD family membrane protein YckC
MRKLHYEDASYVRRFFGFIIDRLWMLIIFVLVLLKRAPDSFYPQFRELYGTSMQSTLINTLLVMALISFVILMFFIKKFNATPGMWMTSLRFVPIDRKGKVNSIILSILVIILVNIKYLPYINLITLFSDKNKSKQTILNKIARVKVQIAL